MELIFGIIGFILIVIGIVEAARKITFASFCGETEDSYFLVISPRDAQSCEYSVRQAAEKLRWMNLQAPCGLICLNQENDPEIQCICEKLKKKYTNLIVSNYSELRYNMEQEDVRI